ncbi:hypothetical protein [Flavobacterium hungaricum]|uniref:Uncharacterized protein n=1 Tax=Flavobacterium hungaricum TaxID=2082725 RepID=A0ABR9TIN7_9FLAO|nr:hypothetical protein [Flavobacterium hungaricum]MBE8725213.1 hypothetical protein [Flavobacterium hungaricum]
MTKFFSSFFENWFKPIWFWFVSTLLLLFSSSINNSLIQTIIFGLFGLALLGLLASALYQLSEKRWLKSLISLLLFGATIFILILVSMAAFFIADETPDTWAKNLTIPKNIPIDNPIDLESFDTSKRPDSITNRVVEKIDFQLYNSFQPGLYEYDFWVGKIESGTIYLKAFEITQKQALSAEDLPSRTFIQIYNPTDSIKKFSTHDHFTIYEGDWGDPYAARFEVWLKPDNGAKERKLFSKNYKIEGWMR